MFRNWFWFSRVTHFLVLLLLLGVSLFPLGRTVLAQEPVHPLIVAQLVENKIQTYLWPLDHTLQLTVFDPSTANNFTTTAVVAQSPDSPDKTVTDFPLGDLVIRPGLVLTVTDLDTSGTPLSYTVQNVQILSTDPATDLVTGTAPPSGSVELWVCNHQGQCIRRDAAIDADGFWVANFSLPGVLNGEVAPALDIQLGAGIGVEYCEVAPGCTTYLYKVPYPTISAYWDANVIEAQEWPIGAEVTLYIDDPETEPMPDYTTTQTMVPAEWDSQVGFTRFTLPGYFPLQPGFEVSVSGPGMTKTLTVADLLVSEVRLNGDTIAGTAPAGLLLTVGGICNFTECAVRSPSIGSDGRWLADFGAPGLPPEEQTTINLTTGMEGYVSVAEPDRDATVVKGPLIEFYVGAFPQSDSIQVEKISEPAHFALSVDDPLTADVDFGDKRFSEEDAFNIYLETHDLKPGDIITVKAGITTKTFSVHNLSVRSIDHSADTVSGLSVPGHTILAWIAGSEITRQTTAGADGSWVIDWSTPGDPERPGELFTYDIVPGSMGYVDTHDGSFNTTAIGWYALDVSIQASPDLLPINSAITATATISTPFLKDNRTALWDWGDGTKTSVDFTEDESTSASHVYTVPGVYTPRVLVTDSAGAWGAASFQYAVVYDPSSGFVTGNGTILSPVGAYSADPALTGEASFGFVSRYKKGASIPAGSMEFVFNIANINFQSTAYEWLTVSGAKAQLKGLGSLNGQGGYKFFIAAIDGAIKGKGEPDQFRIKIWFEDTTGELIVYDNQLGATLDTDPTTLIQSGSIVIHK